MAIMTPEQQIAEINRIQEGLTRNFTTDDIGDYNPRRDAINQFINAQLKSNPNLERYTYKDPYGETEGYDLIREKAPSSNYVWNNQLNEWSVFDQSDLKGGLFGGKVGNVMGKLGDIAMSPITYSVKGIKELSGSVFDDALGMEGFSRTLDRVADKDIAAQKGVTDAVSMASEGDIRQGLKHSDDGIRTFGRDPAVAPVLAAVGAYFGGPAVAGLLGGGAAGAAGAGAALGAGTARAQGVEDSKGLLKAAGTGAVAGGAGAAGSQVGSSLAKAGYVSPAMGQVAGAGIGGALGGAGTTAVQGGNRNEILKSGLMGGAQGLATAGTSQLGKQYRVSPFLTKTATGALTGGLKGGSQGAEYGAIGGLLSGLGGQYGGKLGATAGGLLAKDYIQNDIRDNRQEQMQNMIALRRQQMMNDPRYQAYMKAKSDPEYARKMQMYQKYMAQKNQARPQVNGYNQDQMRQAYSQYLAQKRG